MKTLYATIPLLVSLATRSLVMPAAVDGQSAPAPTDGRVGACPRAAPVHPTHRRAQRSSWEIRRAKDHPFDVAAYDLRQPSPKHTDLARLKTGQVGAQFWSIYTDGEMKDSGYSRVQLEQFDIARRVIAHYPDRLSLRAHGRAPYARTFARGNGSGHSWGLEGGHAIENSLALLRAVLCAGRAVHDADAQRHPRLGRCGDGQRAHGGLTDSARRSCAR